MLFISQLTADFCLLPVRKLLPDTVKSTEGYNRGVYFIHTEDLLHTESQMMQPAGIVKKFIAEVVMEADTFNYQRMSGKTG